MNKTFFLFLLVVIIACNSNQENKKQEMSYKSIGSIERLDPALDNLISPYAKIEIIADGFDWSEGPLWIGKHKMLLFSDIPPNTIYKWTEEKGKEIYLTPSGYTDTLKRGGEIGSNGLILDKEGNLVLCQHGDRRMARMDAPLDKPAPKFITLAGKYDGKRLNSPNDAVYNSAGELFFTDPPYGLETQDDKDPKKEIPFNGVYKVKTTGEIILLLDSITRPNGLAFLPGEKKLIIACSDPAKPYWYIYDVNDDSLSNGKIFYNAAEEASKGVKGLPDGLKIDKNGNVFATGPGGVYIFNSEGKKLGLIKFTESTSNCAFSTDEKTLFVTNDMNLVRIKLRD
jgi:gluconolactonase